MLASTRPNQGKCGRRGIVLVLILGVLALMAVIGVTFATFSGQSRISARNFAQSVNQPQRDELMDYALAQLISDTADIRSAIRGHSMARDMYGNDANYQRLPSSRPDGAFMSPQQRPLLLHHEVAPGHRAPARSSTSRPTSPPATRRSTATTSPAGRCGSRTSARHDHRHSRDRPDARGAGRQRVCPPAATGYRTLTVNIGLHEGNSARRSGTSSRSLPSRRRPCSTPRLGLHDPASGPVPRCSRRRTRYRAPGRSSSTAAGCTPSTARA